MATESKLTTPKNEDHVSAAQREGIFEIVGVNSLMQTANIRLVDGTGHVIPNVPWTMLTSVARK
jgi:hypothetical protein